MAPHDLAPSVRLRSDEGPSRTASVTEAFGPGPWLVVVPHDDDLVLGMGLLVAAAAGQIEVHVAVVTDGAMGYERVAEQAELVTLRRHELEQAAAVLGVPESRVHWLGFPDGALYLHQGCRHPGEPPALGQRLAALMRDVGVGAVFCCTPGDTHPDHHITASEVDIAVFWASSRIWLELGEPISAPARWDYAVYCGFGGPPDAEVRCDHALLEKKLAALECFQSQGAIEPIVQELSAAGPLEYFKRAGRTPYHPEDYRTLFD